MRFTSRTPVTISFFIFLILLSVSQAYAWEASWGHIYDDYCTPADCVMYLPMDEGAGGYANDTTPNENNGTINGSTWTAGKFGNGLEFDGVDDYVSFPVTDIPVTSFTVSMWIKPHNLSVYQNIWHPSGKDWWLRQAPSGEFEIYLKNSTGTYFNLGPYNIPQADTFYHVVLQYDDSEKCGKSYINGEIFKNISISNSTFPNIDLGTSYPLGYPVGSVNFFNGIIDEVRIYNRSLSAAEIEQHYQTGWLAITLKDEDTNATITGELGTVNVYDASDSTIVSQETTTTGTVAAAAVFPGDTVISAYTNESYTNQRRMTYFASGPAEYTTTIKLLEDGRGLAQPFKVYDRTTYQGLESAGVRVNYSGEILDYGVTDAQGRLYSYLDPYKLYSVVVDKPDYQTSDEYSLTPSTSDFIVYLLKLLAKPPEPSVSWNPSRDILSLNETYIPMVSIENYQELTAIDFIIAKGRTYLDYYRQTGQEQAGTVDHESFDMQNLSWCNATWICSYTPTSITFRYSQDALSDYSDYAIVQYNYTKTDGEKKTGEKTYIFSDFKVNIAGLFTDTQKPFVAFGIIFFGTFIVIKNLVMRGYNPSVKQIGAIVYILLLVTFMFELLPESYVVLGTLMYLGALLGGKVI